MVPPFSANLGFLWNQLPLAEGIAAAKRAGFGAVECHFPYKEDPQAVAAALAATELPMISLNTASGLTAAGQRGLAAVPGHTREARQLIDQAVDYALAIGCRHVHVMAGNATGSDARATFLSNLNYGAERAAESGIGLLIEPINQGDMPGYFLSSVDEAAAIVAEVGADNLGIMFDCYHVALIHGDVIPQFEAHIERIHHVQFAAVPDRGEPDHGEVDYATLLPRLASSPYDGFFGAEYRPQADVEAGLSWMAALGNSTHLTDT